MMKPYNNTNRNGAIVGLIGRPDDTRVLLNGNGRRATSSQEWLITIADDSSTVFSPETNIVNIGRSAENEMVLEDFNVSRRHAQLEYHHDGWYVSDLASTNGSYLDETPLLPYEPVKWTDGQILRFGQCQLAWQPVMAVANNAQLDDVHKTMVMRAPETSVVVEEPVAVEASRQQCVVTIEASPTQAELTLDSPVRLQVIITNEGSTADRFVVGCIGLPRSWVRMPSRPILLDAGQSKTIPVLVQPVHISHTKPGTTKYHFCVHAVSDPMPVKSAECQITIGTYEDISLNFRPKKVRESEKMQIALHNNGNTTAVYKLGATSPLEKLDFRGERHHLLLPPGANESSYAQIKLAQRRWVGRKRSLPLEIQMTNENGSVLTAAGKITTIPVIPWYWVAAMIGIICAGAWWMFLA